MEIFNNILLVIFVGIFTTILLFMALAYTNKKRKKANLIKKGFLFKYDTIKHEHAFNLFLPLEPTSENLLNNFIFRLSSYEEITVAKDFFDYHYGFNTENGNSLEFLELLHLKLNYERKQEKNQQKQERLNSFFSYVNDKLLKINEFKVNGLFLEKSEKNLAFFKLVFTVEGLKYDISSTHEGLANLLYNINSIKKFDSIGSLRKTITEIKIGDYISDDQATVVKSILFGQKKSIEELFPEKFKSKL